jgi:hypothetical protein
MAHGKTNIVAYGVMTMIKPYLFVKIVIATITEMDGILATVITKRGENMSLDYIAEHLKHIREYLGYIAIVVVFSGVHRCSVVMGNNVKSMVPCAHHVIKKER